MFTSIILKSNKIKHALVLTVKCSRVHEISQQRNMQHGLVSGSWWECGDLYSMENIPLLDERRPQVCFRAAPGALLVRNVLSP